MRHAHVILVQVIEALVHAGDGKLDVVLGEVVAVRLAAFLREAVVAAGVVQAALVDAVPPTVGEVHPIEVVALLHAFLVIDELEVIRTLLKAHLYIALLLPDGRALLQALLPVLVDVRREVGAFIEALVLLLLDELVRALDVELLALLLAEQGLVLGDVDEKGSRRAEVDTTAGFFGEVAVGAVCGADLALIVEEGIARACTHALGARGEVVVLEVEAIGVAPLVRAVILVDTLDVRAQVALGNALQRAVRVRVGA